MSKYVQKLTARTSSAAQRPWSRRRKKRLGSLKLLSVKEWGQSKSLLPHEAKPLEFYFRNALRDSGPLVPGGHETEMYLQLQEATPTWLFPQELLDGEWQNGLCGPTGAFSAKDKIDRCLRVQHPGTTYGDFLSADWPVDVCVYEYVSRLRDMEVPVSGNLVRRLDFIAARLTETLRIKTGTYILHFVDLMKSAKVRRYDSSLLDIIALPYIRSIHDRERARLRAVEEALSATMWA